MAMAVGQWAGFLIALVAGWCAVGAFPAAAAPAAQAVALAGPASCPAAEIIGVHGTGEGPSATDTQDSPEIKATFSAFTADEQSLGEHGADLEYYPYPTVSFADFLPANWSELAIAINEYADDLEAQLESFSYACPATPISLVGYSLGALLINDMLSSYSNESKYIDGVELYGDPCWYNPHGGYGGLARYAAKVGFPLRCFPENAYPFPLVSAVSPHFLVQSLCKAKDPVCGQDWVPYDLGGQIIAAALCAVYTCPHRSYVGIATNYGAEFLAANAFKPVGRGGQETAGTGTLSPNPRPSHDQSALQSSPLNGVSRFGEPLKGDTADARQTPSLIVNVRFLAADHPLPHKFGGLQWQPDDGLRSLSLSRHGAPVGLTTDESNDGHYSRKAAVISWLSVPVLS
jgi:Cutinase